MCPLLMSLPLLALLASLGLENDLLANNLVVPLELRPAADVGKQATAAKGPAGKPAIEVTGSSEASTATLINCDLPEFSLHEYVLRGKVKYSGVVGDGYLELWSDFGDKGKYFTRSLGDWGVMKKISGTSDWRDFELPFYANPGMKLKGITLNVVLPGAGKVMVAEPLVIGPLGSSGQWWTERQGGLVGGGLGSFVGILGGLIGLTASWGKSRKLTVSLCGIGLAISGVALIAGIVALCMRQPFHVTYPLLLVGLIGVGVLGFNLRKIVRRFQDDELRRMTAADVA